MTPVEQQGSNGVSICIAANFTIEPIEEFLEYWFGQLEISAQIRFAPYNQVFQQLLEGGLLRSNRGGINLVALDLDTWLVEGHSDDARAQLNKTVEEFLGVLRNSGTQGAGGAVLLFPPAANLESQREDVDAVAAARTLILSTCEAISGWSALDLSRAAMLYSVAESRDPFTDELGNIPFTEAMYVAAGTAVARRIHCVRSKARKVIVLDCDNTLWKGVCGEGAVQLTEPYRRLHECMLRQREEGVLLAIASKNNEADVLAVLDSAESVLKAEHFTAWQINWQPKSENLKALSEELGLALNSFLFLDDSPLECMEVRNSCPEVLAIALPQDESAFPGFLEHLWAFDRPAATEEDRNRASMYQAEKQRADLSHRALTREEFLAGLNIEIHVARASDSELDRVSQLTHRTTQFNMTGILHTVQSLGEKLAQPGSECWTVRVKDTFGDYGLVGALVFDTQGENLRIDTFLLSCRALGRGVEDRMAEDLKGWALERGADRVVIPFIPTARNKPALEFLARCCEVSSSVTEPFECVLAASGHSSEWRPAEPVQSGAPKAIAPAAVAAKASDESELLVKIASQLQSAEAIVKAVRSNKKRRPVEAGAFVMPHVGIEETMARIWSDCLAVEPIGSTDNFFDFGGQSLIATRILTQVRLEFGVEMGLAHLFERPTVRELASYVANAGALNSQRDALPSARSS